MVENFGSYLKHERELRGVPLEEISGATKIHIRYLKALEENSFDQLPGEVFVKGYIRSYANTIGSDVEEMLNIYKESVEFKNQESIPQKTSALTTQTKTFFVYGLAILVVAIIMFGVGVLLKNGIGDSSSKPEAKQAPSFQVPDEVTKAEVTEQESSTNFNSGSPQFVEEIKVDQEADSVEPEALEQKVPAVDNSSDAAIPEEGEKLILPPHEVIEQETPGVSPLNSDSQDPSSDADKFLRLTIRANETSWFNMTIDNFREEDFILPSGTAKTFRGNEVFRLTVGNKAGVELLLNGQTLTFPESKDKVIKDFIINSKLIE